MQKTKKNLIVLFFTALSGILISQPTSTFTGKPTYQILTKRAGNLLGIINIELFPNIAPLHARNFDSLVSTHFYDTTAFHRVIPGFMIQGGDPNSRHGAIGTWGLGNPSQPKVNAEFTTAKHLRGILSAARQANNIHSATSQFFICVANYPSLDGKYSVYGRVTSGMNFVDTIVNAPRNMTTNNPLQKIEMFITRVGSNDTIPKPPVLLSPATGTVGLDTLPFIQLKWKSVSDGIIYHLDVSTDSLFATTLVSYDSTALFYKLTGLTGSTKYFWRLRTNNGGHYSAYSPTWNFHTQWITETKVIYNTLEKTELTIFPNPSNGNFTFKGVTKGSSIYVYDITGKQILNYVAGDTPTIVDLSDKDKGVYSYRVALNGIETSQGKLILR